MYRFVYILFVMGHLFKNPISQRTLCFALLCFAFLCFASLCFALLFPVYEILAFDLMSAAIHPQVSIIWGSKDPSTKYALVLRQDALSTAKGLFFQPEIHF